MSNVAKISNIIYPLVIISILIALIIVRYVIFPSIDWTTFAAISTSSNREPVAQINETDEGVVIIWWGGWDGGFMGDMKITSNHGDIILPLPKVGERIYLNGTYKSNDTVVFVEDESTKSWVCVGNC